MIRIKSGKTISKRSNQEQYTNSFKDLNSGQFNQHEIPTNPQGDQFSKKQN